jgi:membrane protease subunit (stomatin/prohibitin family)
MVVRPRRGLIGTVATTAVVAGTATMTSNAINNRAMRKAQQEQAEALAAQPQESVPGGSDVATQLQNLAQLRNAGVLNEAEFETAKAKLLA